LLVELPHATAAALLPVRADAFEDADAVVQRVREHVHLGFGERDELSVHQDVAALDPHPCSRSVPEAQSFNGLPSGSTSITGYPSAARSVPIAALSPTT